MEKEERGMREKEEMEYTARKGIIGKEVPTGRKEKEDIDRKEIERKEAEYS